MAITKNRATLVLTAVLAFVLLAAITALAGAAALRADAGVPPNVQQQAAAAEPNRLPPGTGAPGVYVARDWRVIDPAVYPVVGGHDTFTWQELEPGEGVYNWTRLDAFITNQAALGKKAAFGITVYNGRIEGGLVVPGWFQFTYPGSLIACTGVTIPRYWDNNYLIKYGAFVDALAARYGNDPRIEYAQIGVGLYGEIQPADDSDDACIKAAMDADFGYTTDPERAARWVQTIYAVIDRWGLAFAGKSVRLFLVYTPRFIDVCEKRDATNYGASTYEVGLFAGGIYPDTVTVFSNPPGGMGCQKWDPIVYWNGVTTRTIPVALESYRYMLPDYNSFYWGVLSGLNKHADYLSLESDLLYNGTPNNPITENFAMIRFANTYLGKTAGTTPNAWIALRDTAPAHNGFGCNRPTTYRPQYGDYDFYLYRDDTVTGGRTITASSTMTYVINDSFCGTMGSVVTNTYYAPILAGKGPQGWMTRRTDNASGNSSMYFRLDDSFVSGQGITTALLITVTYLDNGNNFLVLRYMTPGNAEQSPAVQRTNTGQWRTHTFSITDIDLTGKYPKGNDFVLYNGGATDIYVHMVMAGKWRALGPTPTPTRTPTVTATATPTPITVVFQHGMSPDFAYDGGSDTFISNYGDPTANYGDSSVLRLRNSDLRSGLMRFDVSSIPGYATVESATLSVYVDGQTNANTLPVSVHRLRRPWIDMQATWISATNAAIWGAAGANDPSTDYDAAAVDSTTLSTTNYWQAFNITSLVQQWLLNPSANYGLLLNTGNEGSVEYQLRSNEYSTPAMFRPMLTIVYRVPGGPTPTSTRTNTPTRTPTITQTPTPTPVVVTFQKGVSPQPSYTGVIDTFISNFGDTGVNFGAEATLRLRNTDTRAGLLRFDVASIPPTVNVQAATLSLHVYNRTNANPLPVSAFRMIRPWTELGATWNQAAVGVPWTTGGANGLGSDRDDLIVDSVTLDQVGAWYDFNVSDIARLWVQSPAQNQGVVIKAADGGSVEYDIWSSDYLFAPEVRPRLIITYTTYFSGPTPTPTRTRTSTPSPTVTPSPTPSPLAVVFQEGVSPQGSYTGVSDTFISNFGDTGANYGISPTLELRSNDVRSALLRFDLSSLPPTSNIVSATLSVHVDYQTNNAPLPINLFRMLRSWEETEATWIKATNAANWSVPGANGGGDRATTASSSLTMSSADTWYDFNVTTLAQQWLTSPQDNKGVILKPATGPSVAYVLRSSEYFAAPAFRPKLTILCYNCAPQSGYRIMLPVIISSFTSLQ